MAFEDDFKVSISFPRRDKGEEQTRVSQLQCDLDSIARISGSWNLKLNPGKCVGVRFGSAAMEGQPEYEILGVPVAFRTKYRDLGVTVDSRLRFHDHVDIVVGRVSSMISNLLRSTVCRSPLFMTTLWVSHIRPLLEFNSCVWNVGYLCDTKRLESLQRRWTAEVEGLAVVEYSERLRMLGLFSVGKRFLRLDLVKIWKCFNSRVDVGLLNLFEHARGGSTRGHQYKLSIPICRSEIWRRMFAVRCVTVWNSLPASLVQSGSVEAFKRGLDFFLGEALYS